MATARENDDWVAELQSTGEVQEEALAHLRKILVGGLLRSFRGKGVDQAFCEDIAQDAVIKILDKLDQFQGRSRFTTWAMSIAIRTAISELRKRHFKNISLDDLSAGGQSQIEVADESTVLPEAAQQRKNVLSALNELIASKLSDRQRVALEGLLAGMTVEDLAIETDSNRNAVYKLVYDARQKLKRELEQRGYDALSIKTLFP